MELNENEWSPSDDVLPIRFGTQGERLMDARADRDADLDAAHEARMARLYPGKALALRYF